MLSYSMFIHLYKVLSIALSIAYDRWPKKLNALALGGWPKPVYSQKSLLQFRDSL